MNKPVVELYATRFAWDTFERDALMSPLTWSFESGVPVPIPKLPLNTRLDST